MSLPTSYATLTGQVSRHLKPLRTQHGDVMRAFGDLSQAALKDGALDKATKELIAMAIGIASRCDDCLGFHARALVKLGVEPAAFHEMLGVAVYMGGGPSLMYAAHAQAAYDEFRDQAATAAA